MPVIPAGEGGEVFGGESGENVASRVISTANKYVGTRYRSGGSSAAIRTMAIPAMAAPSRAKILVPLTSIVPDDGTR